MKKQIVKKVIKKKVTGSTETLVNFILDETGSMISCKEATISGFNEYIKNLQKEKNKIYFSLTTFNSSGIKTPYVKTLIQDIKPLTPETYQPNNLTPLYDAIAKTVKAVEKTNSKKILCVIMSDGEENASKEYTRTKLFDLIKDKEKEGWNFIYLGANQDSWQVGNAIGLSKGNVMNYSTANMQNVMRGLSGSTACYASSQDIQTVNFFDDYNYTDKDKKEVTKS